MKQLTTDQREIFYLNCVCNLINDKSSSILVCGGGTLDKSIFEKAGFKNVTISNLDSRMNENEYNPFKWKYENAESLSFNSGSFDFVVIHAAIHHASSPHRVLTEKYRVARKGVLAFESRDSTIMRFFEKSGLAQVYEHSAVFYNDCKYGGVNNTEIPNYIYRWTEREIEKTISAYAPYCKHKFTYKYATAFPCTPQSENKGQIKVILLKLIRPFFYVFVKIFPRQQNMFSFYIEKPVISESHFPWLIVNNSGSVVFNKEWGSKRYKSQI